MNGIDMWSHLKDMGEAVEWYEHTAVDETGGYRTPVFADEAVELVAVIRPWQDDVPQVIVEGQTGQTPGFKCFFPTDAPVALNDRIHWENSAFRLSNPQHDNFSELVKWDLRTDERELIHESDLSSTDDLEPPNREVFS